MPDVTTIGIGVDSSEVPPASTALDRLVASAERTEGALQALLRQSGEMNRSVGQTAKSADNMAVSVAKGGTAALFIEKAISATVRATADAIRNFVQLGFAVGDYMDIAERTMADPAGLASLQTAADVSGTSLQTVASSIQAMERQLASTKGEASSAAKALAAIGLSLEEFKRLSGDEKVRALSVALRGYADDGAKVAAVQMIMGRGAAQNLGLLKELGQETERSNLITSEMIKRADDAGDAIKRQQSEVRQLASALAIEMLPAVQVIQGAMSDLLKDLLGVESEAKRLSQQTALREWALDAADIFAELAGAIETSVKLMLTAGKTIGYIATLLSPKPEGVSRGKMSDEDRKAFQSSQQAIRDAYAEDLGRIWDPKLLSERIREAVARARAKGPAGASEADSARPLPSIKLPEDDAAAEKAAAEKAAAEKAAKARERELERHRKEYDRLTDAVDKYTATQALLASTGDSATSMDQLRARVMSELNDITNKYTITERNRVVGMLAAAEAQFRASEETKRAIESARESSKLYEAQAAALRDIEGQTASVTSSIERYGKTQSEVFSIEQNELEQKRELVKWTAEQSEAGSDQYNILMAQVRAIGLLIQRREELFKKQQRDREDPKTGAENAIKRYAEEAKNLGSAMDDYVTNGIRTAEDALTEFVRTGKMDIRSLINDMIAEFMRLNIIKPFLSSLLSGLTGGGGGFDPVKWLVGVLGSSGGAGSMGADYSLSGAGVRFRAAGGDVESGKPYIVGEKGPELMVPRSNGTIIPNGAGQSFNVTYAPSIHVDSRSDQAQVVEIARRVTMQGNKQLIEHLRARGARV